MTRGARRHLSPRAGAAIIGMGAVALALGGCETPAPTPPPPSVCNTGPAALPLVTSAAEREVVSGELIVRFRSGAGTVSANRLSRLKLDPGVRRLSGGAVLVRLPSSEVGLMTTEAARGRTMERAAEIAASGQVDYAQPNYIVRQHAAPNDPCYALQWHYHVNGFANGQSPGGINLASAWDTNKGSRGVVVAVIDTGIRPDHEDIAPGANLVAGYDFVSDPTRANDGDGRDSDPTDPGDPCFGFPASWHGTHVAGTVGAVHTDNAIGAAGVNWEVGIQPLRVLGICGGTTADIVDAIRWAAGLPVPGVPDNPTPAKVINMSLGGGFPCSQSPADQAAINDAFAAGATVVVSAGNDASDASGSTPASCDNVITVAASDARGQLATRYSNFGSTVEIMAPGGDVQRDDNNDGEPDGVLSTVRDGYDWYNGTSMAAPHVAGAAALLLAKDGSLSPTQVREAIQNNAIPRDSSQCPQACGSGLLNADFD